MQNLEVSAHIFFPLTVAYVLTQEVLETPASLSVAGFDLLSDLEQLMGRPGPLHSFITLGPICLALFAGEEWFRGELVLTPLIVAFILSDLVLDFIDGEPIWLLAPTRWYRD